MAQNSHFGQNGLNTSSISLKICINDSLLVKKLSEQRRQISICVVAVMAKNLKMAKMAENGSFFILFPLFTDFICKRVIEMENLAFYSYFNLKTEYRRIWPQKPLVIF